MSEKWSMEFFNIRRKGTNSQHGLQRISSMIAQKHDRTYSKILDCISCKLSYSLLDSAIMCLRGARSSIHRPTTSPDTMDLPAMKAGSLYTELNPHTFKSNKDTVVTPFD